MPKHKKSRAAKVKSDNPCRVCGEMIPYDQAKYHGPANYYAARTCPKSSGKNCWSIWLRTASSDKSRRVPKPAEDEELIVPVNDDWEWPVDTRSDDEIRRLNEEQSRLNVSLAKRLAEQHGYGHSDVKVLNPSKFEGVYTPPGSRDEWRMKRLGAYV